jgi:hypothetical protein
MQFRVRLSLILFPILVALLLCIGFAMCPIDGFIGNVRLLFVEDTTNWADEYSDKRFRAVRVGMSQSEVYKLLGKPFGARPYPDGTIGKSWAMIRRNSSYRRREVIFDKDYRVVRTIAEVVIQHEED